MIDLRKNCVRCPTVLQSFVVGKTTQVTKKDSIDVFCPIAFMATDEGDVVRNTKPSVQMINNMS